ncbi:MAG TPA: hypothetical protein PKD70_06190 [Saprospiraceae bacterium]|nr:hypothetical protein [Saprospiraceae bacterium]
MAKQTNLPIDRVKPVVRFFARFISNLLQIDSNKDGRIQWLEALNMIQVTAFDAFKEFVGFNFAEFKAQLKDIDQTERRVLIDAFKENFRLSEIEAELLLETWLDLLEHGVTLYERTARYLETRKNAAEVF